MKSPRRGRAQVPLLMLRVEGDGWAYVQGRPRKTPDKIFHREFWMEEKDGTYTNRVRVRKSKKRFPDLPPLKSG